MAYSMFLDGVQVPVIPSKVEITISNQNSTINLINEGEVNILKSPGLTEISFDLMLPQVRYPFAVYTNGFKKASYYLDKLNALKSSKKPFQFIFSRMSPKNELLFDTNLKVSI